MSEILFKFCSGKGAAAILQNSSIFITSPLDLNDPFEMRPGWTNAHRERHRQNEERRNELTRGMPVFAAMKGDKAIPIGPLPDMPPAPEMNVEDQRGIADVHNAQVFSALHARFRVLSLVGSLPGFGTLEDQLDVHPTLMWSHYADQFQGICLGLVLQL